MTTVETVPSPTPQQKDSAAAYLASSRDELMDAVKDLYHAQWTFQREPGEWSIAGILEHLAIIEGRVQMLISRLPDAPPAEPDRNEAEIEALILQAIPHRTSRVPAPDAAQPKGECTPFESFQEFIRKRERTLDFLHTAPCLRGRVLPHPVFGLWDGYQWILATAAHTVRHVDQIREIKSLKAYPKSFADSPA